MPQYLEPAENRKVRNISLDVKREVYSKSDVARTIDVVNCYQNDKMYEINDEEPEYSSDLKDERVQESRFVGELNNEASEEKEMVLIEAPLGVVTKINMMIKCLVETLRKYKI
ncbi:30571_t:CDS:2 [Racocetra persica]|uniref:30571_t:CDS:1 n=1 Tax=Racocetra persica TaxID=160502 RepID=A0ACA9KKD3_9GLOM|nr:30571_t:CDS:2 [Racocetra persica]